MASQPSPIGRGASCHNHVAGNRSIGRPGTLADVRKHLTIEDLGDLVDLPLLAVLATYRRDGTVLLSPVWHEWRDGGFNVVTRSVDGKARHLQRDPRANIVLCEHVMPYRGVELQTTAQLITAGADEATRRIASRYLGEAAGAAYAARAEDDVIVRLEPGALRAWDFADESG
jgi:PPOX class probable F420-dependent enzyme